MSVAPSYTLCKDERLCGKRAIEELYAAGTRFFKYPYKAYWLQTATDGAYPCSFVISVPKRRFKRAVQRNLLKRRTREAFRLNKHLLNVVGAGLQIHLMLVYASDEMLAFSEINAAMQKTLQHIAQQYAAPI
jgi:ribonuclease P protein component